MDKQSSKIIGLFARYFLILLVGIGNLYLFYKILTPITLRAVASVLSLFSDPIVIDNVILMKKAVIEMIPACVAGAAFYLLFLLVMSTADLKPKKRILILISSFAILFFLNTLRLVLLVPLTTSPYFETIHWVFWHLISTVFVVAVWFTMILIFNIKTIPVYSDLKYISSFLKKPGKKSKRSK